MGGLPLPSTDLDNLLRAHPAGLSNLLWDNVITLSIHSSSFLRAVPTIRTNPHSLQVTPSVFPAAGGKYHQRERSLRARQHPPHPHVGKHRLAERGGPSPGPAERCSGARQLGEPPPRLPRPQPHPRSGTAAHKAAPPPPIPPSPFASPDRPRGVPSAAAGCRLTSGGRYGGLLAFPPRLRPLFFFAFEPPPPPPGAAPPRPRNAAPVGLQQPPNSSDTRESMAAGAAPPPRCGTRSPPGLPAAPAPAVSKPPRGTTGNGVRSAARLQLPARTAPRLSRNCRSRRAPRRAPSRPLWTPSARADGSWSPERAAPPGGPGAGSAGCRAARGRSPGALRSGTASSGTASSGTRRLAPGAGSRSVLKHFCPQKCPIKAEKQHRACNYSDIATPCRRALTTKAFGSG